MKYYINKITDDIRHDLKYSVSHFINDLVANQGKMVKFEYKKRADKNIMGNKIELYEFRLNSSNDCDWNKRTTGYWLISIDSSIFDKIFTTNKPSHFSNELFVI